MEDIVWILVGIVVTIAIVIMLFKWLNGSVNIANPIETTGEIVDIEEINTPGVTSFVGGDGEVTRFYPVVRFRVNNNQLVRFRDRKGVKDKNDIQKGAEVKVIYEKGNPLIAKIVG